MRTNPTGAERADRTRRRDGVEGVGVPPAPGTDGVSGRRVARAATAVSAGVVALAWVAAGVASAHVGVTSDASAAGAYAVLSFSVPHGCSGSPTTELAVQVPEGINAVTPTRNALYTLETVVEELATPATDSHGNEVTERVSEVVWTALEPLPEGQRDVLQFSLQLPADAAGTTLYFPVIQTCESGESAWVEIPADGQDPHDLALPAPSVTVLEADAEAGRGATGAGSGAAEGPNLVLVAMASALLGVVIGGLGLGLLRKRA